MAIQFQQKCTRCMKNYVLVSNRTRGPRICYACHKLEMNGTISDPEMKKFFDIPEEFYKKNSFLRNIKISYLRFGSLTENQIDAFKRTVEDLKKNGLP